MKHRRTGFTGTHLLALVATAALFGCGHHFEPPSEEERIVEADDLYDPQIFDTVVWESPHIRDVEGDVVFASKCRNCHGVMGAGGTAYALQRDLEVPSLVEAHWAFAGDLEGLRHHIFIGHMTGMPTWGVAGITPREIDAAAHYILELLRPEVLDTDGT
jgi:hypothetical protein